MPNPFDGLSMNIFDIVNQTMGYDVTWSPSGGGDEQTGRALFSKPTQHVESYQYRDEYGKVEYDPNQYRMEWKEPDFVGLKAAVDANETTEVVVIEGNSFEVMKVHQVFDGRTYIAILNPTA